MNTNIIRDISGKSIPYLLVLLFFSIPINTKIAIPFIPILAFAWLLSGDWEDIFVRIKGNLSVILLASFWVLHGIGLFYSKNVSYGLLDMQHKLSFLVFPIIFISSSHRIIPVKKWFFWAFISGCIAAGIIMLANASYLSISFVESKLLFNPIPPDAWWENYFMYKRLSTFHHTSYMAMYLTFSIALLFQLIKVSKSNYSISIKIIGIIFLYIIILLLSSRAGILIGTITLMFGLIWLLYNKYKKVALIISVSSIVTVSYLFIHFNERFVSLNNSFGNLTNNELIVSDTTRNEIRIQIWSSIPSTLENNWIFGFGTGDSKDELLAGYERLQLINLLGKQYNAHNQYFETIAALGIFGLALLLTILFLPVYRKYIAEKEILPVFFIGIIALNLIFESMFSRIAGVMYFAVFFCLIFTKEHHSSSKRFDIQ